MSSQPPPIPKTHRIAPIEDSPTPKRVNLAPTKPRASHLEALFRGAIVFVILVSLGAAYWSFFHRLLPLQRQAREITTRISTMTSSLDELERRWSPEQAGEIRAQYRQVYSQLFSDQIALEGWLARLQTHADPLALDIKVDLGQSKAKAGFDDNLAVIPASISLEVRPEPGEAEGKSPYERLLQFTQQLAIEGKRADLAELNVVGGAGSVSRALLVFNLWAGDLGAETLNNNPAVLQ
jgi:hypothetical protein